MQDAEQEGLERAKQLYVDAFGEVPEFIGIAPGRVNLIGEHTDYNEGYVFPAAIDKEVFICARPSKGNTHVFSAEMGEGQTFDSRTVSPGDVHEWAAYGAGIAWALREECNIPMPNLEAVVHGEVPIGSGISSSAALELAFAVVWNKFAELKLPNQELAKLGQKCENKFVGVNSGIMDQMASAMGKAGYAIFLDTRSLDIQYAQIPDELVIVLCDTCKPRALTDSAYNERRRQCEQASRDLGVKSIRDANLELLERKRSAMADVIYRRAKHVITENARCLRFVSALDEKRLSEIGALMKASHESLKTDYEVSCPELDAMAESAWDAKGCVGARMTGAGFGGACVALVESAAIPDFVAETATAYKNRTGLGGNFIPCKAADGARAV